MTLTITDLLAIAFVIGLCVAGKYKLLEKMGEEGWKALIPFYGDYAIYAKVWTGWAYWCGLLLWVLINMCGYAITGYVFHFILLFIYFLIKGMFACKLTENFGKNHMALVIGIALPWLGNIIMTVMGFVRQFQYCDKCRFKTVLLDDVDDIFKPDTELIDKDIVPMPASVTEELDLLIDTEAEAPLLSE